MYLHMPLRPKQMVLISPYVRPLYCYEGKSLKQSVLESDQSAIMHILVTYDSFFIQMQSLPCQPASWWIGTVNRTTSILSPPPPHSHMELSMNYAEYKYRIV